MFLVFKYLKEKYLKKEFIIAKFHNWRIIINTNSTMHEKECIYAYMCII